MSIELKATVVNMKSLSQNIEDPIVNGAASSASNHTMPAGTYLVYYNGTNYYVRTDGKITGSITGNAATVGGYTPGNACTKTVDTSISSTTSANLPTSAAVANYVDSTVDEAIVISSTQPTSANTKIWIKI